MKNKFSKLLAAVLSATSVIFMSLSGTLIMTSAEASIDNTPVTQSPAQASNYSSATDYFTDLGLVNHYGGRGMYVHWNASHQHGAVKENSKAFLVSLKVLPGSEFSASFLLNQARIDANINNTSYNSFEMTFAASADLINWTAVEATKSVVDNANAEVNKKATYVLTVPDGAMYIKIIFPQATTGCTDAIYLSDYTYTPYTGENKEVIEKLDYRTGDYNTAFFSSVTNTEGLMEGPGMKQFAGGAYNSNNPVVATFSQSIEPGSTVRVFTLVSKARQDMADEADYDISFKIIATNNNESWYPLETEVQKYDKGNAWNGGGAFYEICYTFTMPEKAVGLAVVYPEPRAFRSKFNADIHYCAGVHAIGYVPGTTPAADTENKKLVMCIGDSLTAGAEVTKGYRYTDVLASLLGDEYLVKNLGVGGKDLIISNANPYTATDAYSESLTLTPDIVVIMLGTNDSWQNLASKKETYLSDYKTLIDTYKESNPDLKVIVCTSPPRADNDSYANIVQTVLLPLQKQVAEENGATLADVNAVLSAETDYLDDDNIHMNVKGYRLIGETVYKAITDPDTDDGGNQPSGGTGDDNTGGDNNGSNAGGNNSDTSTDNNTDINQDNNTENTPETDVNNTEEEGEYYYGDVSSPTTGTGLKAMVLSLLAVLVAISALLVKKRTKV